MSDVKANDDKQISMQAKAVRKKLLAEKNQSPTREIAFICESFAGSGKAMVNIEPIKVIAFQRLPLDHPLRKLLLAERTLLKPEEYVAKVESWLVLLRENK